MGALISALSNSLGVQLGTNSIPSVINGLTEEDSAFYITEEDSTNILTSED